MAATEVETLVVRLEARLNKYDADMRKLQRQTDQTLARVEKRFDGFSRSLRTSVSNAALGARTALGGLGAYLGVGQLREYADGWTSVTRAVSAGEQSFGVRLRSASELNKLANDARIDLDAYTKLYIRTAAATRELGLEEEKVAKVTSTVAMALKLGSASASEQASVMLQLSQALSKGKLDGDEFRSVMENAVIVQELLADRLKVSKGEIIKMAAEGKLRVPDLIGALLDGGAKVERIYRKMPATIAESFTVLRNTTMEYVGAADQASGASERLVGVLGGVARNFDTIADSAFVVASALLGMFGPRIIGSVLAGGAGIAAVANPIGLLVGAVAAGTAAFYALADNIAVSGDGLVSLQDYLNAVVSLLGERLQPAIDQAAASWNVAVDYIRAGLAKLPVSLEDIVGAVKTAINLTVGIFAAAADAIPALFYYVPNAIGEMFINMVNGVLEAMRQMVRGIAFYLNKIPGIKMGELLVEDFENPLKGFGTKAREAMQNAGRHVGRDFVGEWSAQVSTMSDAVAKEARAIAAGRTLAKSTTVQQAIEPKKVNPSSPDDGKKKRSPFEREVRQVQEHIRAIQLENEMLGASAYETERARVALDLLNAARKEGIKVTPELLAQVDQLSAAYAQAKTDAERMRETFDEMKAVSKDVLKGFISDLKEGTSGAEALRNGLDKIADKLIDMAINSLVEDALGPLLKTRLKSGGSGDGFASVLKVFGFADGGIASRGRPVALPTFAGGGVARSASIFGEAGPEAAVPLPDGRRIPVDLRMPQIPAAAPAPRGGGTGGEVFVTVQAGPELLVTIDNRAAGVVARAAPSIVKESLSQTQKNLPGMVGRMQKRSA